MTPAATGLAECMTFAGVVASLSAGVSAALILLLRPVLLRIALARPSARGLHTSPTPQGGGIGVLCGCVLAVGLAAAWLGLAPADRLRLAAVLGAAALLAALGFTDDIRPLPPLPRLVAQLVAMGIGVAALPEGIRLLPVLPLGMERVLLVLAGTWFINLTNFMDGMDWMTVTEMIPVCGVLVLIWCFGGLPAVPGLIAAGLCGGLAGFAPFNRPVARLFLGDVGSLPVGFLVAYGLFSLAGQGGSPHMAAALLLPLYYLADSGVTLAWRLRHGERIWEPHRSHFYQVAIGRGLSVRQVLLRVGATNGLLAALGLASVALGWQAQALSVAMGFAAVTLLLARLSRAAG